MRRLATTVTCLAILAAACAPGGAPLPPPLAEAPAITTRPSSPTTDSVTRSTFPTKPAPARLASHLFLPVGEQRSIAGLGKLIEQIDLYGESPFRVEGDLLTADAAGISCLRFRYRDLPGENGVQTMCAVAFDETGQCGGLLPLSLDLDMFLEADGAPVGNSDLLTGGDLYAACATATGDLRLQQPSLDLPPLYLVIVDALGGGPYSLGDDEMKAQRAGVITTFSGDELRPPWIVTVGREVRSIEFGRDGTFTVNEEDCTLAPSCTGTRELVQPGDIFRTSLGISPDLLADVLAAADPTLVDAYVRERISIGWSEVSGIHPEASLEAFGRLAILDIMEGLLLEWDVVFGLREKDVIVGYWQPWFVEWEFTRKCYPNEQAKCARIEAAIGEYETERILHLRELGFRLWQTAYLDVDPQGGPGPLAAKRPLWSSFEGVMAGVGGIRAEGVDPGELYGRAVRAYAEAVGPDTPVILFLAGPPITAQTGGEFCEAEICPSDFAGAYRMAEGALTAALDTLSPGQLRGFGAALFEGSHFDLRDPYENFGTFSLNRVAETGYNHPVLNLWRAR